MKKFIEKLTLKQARGLSIFIALTITLILFPYYLLNFSLPKFETITILISLSLLLFLAIYYTVSQLLNVEQKERQLDFSEAKKRVMSEYNWNTTNYIEVKYRYDKELKATATKMLISLFNNSGYRFYVKLSEDENIELVVKDKDENIVYTDTIANFIYFEYHFEKIS